MAAASDLPPTPPDSDSDAGARPPLDHAARAPLLLLAACFWAGIALSGLTPPFPPAATTALFIAAAAAVVASLPRVFAVRAPQEAAPLPRNGRVSGSGRTLLLLAAAFAAGLLSRPVPGAESSLAVTLRALGSDRLARPVRLEGVLTREPDAAGRTTSLALHAERLAADRQEWEVRGRARVTVSGVHQDRLQAVSRGARVSVWCRAAEPRPPSNPGAHEFRGPVGVFGSAKSALLVREIEPGPRLWGGIQELRSAIRDRLRRGPFAPETTAVVAAILIGDRTLASPDTERAFRDAGTLHLMAVSGLHVGLLSLLVYGAAVLCGVARRHALGVLLIVLPLYAALCGGRPSVVRAVLMAVIVILGLRRGLSGAALNGLGLAALALLAFSPWNALDAGFQLSFGATLAIVAAFRPRDPAESSWDPPARWRSWILTPVGVTLAAQAATFPIVAWHFGRVVFGGLLVAVPAGLLGGPLLGLGFAWLGLGDAPLIGEALAALLDIAASALIGLSEWGAALSFGAFPVARPGTAWLLLWGVVAVIALIVRGRRRIVPGLFLTGMALSTLLVRAPEDGVLRVTALDVGMGDALVLGLPEGGAVLVDAGTFFDGWSAGEAVVVPFLAAAGHRRLESVLPTHGDLDHVGGFPAIFRDVRVQEVWEGRGTSEDERRAVRRMHREAADRGIGVRELRTGERFELGGARFSVLLAGDHLTGRAARSNERSVVLAVDYAGRRLLLTGDAGEVTERILLRRYGAALRSDVLKVGHHGSRFSTSPEFLGVVAPRVAIVSVRADPRRGLPDEGVLGRLRHGGARVLRTDRVGAVTVAIDGGGDLAVTTFR